MADRHYPIYDTANFGVAANTLHTLFQTARGGDTTHTKDFTNMRGDGMLPASESFTLQRVAVTPDDGISAADKRVPFQDGYLELFVADRLVLSIPTTMASAHGDWHGMYTQAAAADEYYIGKGGAGFVLNIPIEIPPATPFRVEVFQAPAASAAAQHVKVILDGVLHSPT